MAVINDFIDSKLRDIAHKLPNFSHNEPASFSSGFNSGYKQAILDLQYFLDDIVETIPAEIYRKDFEEL